LFCHSLRSETDKEEFAGKVVETYQIGNSGDKCGSCSLYACALQEDRESSSVAKTQFDRLSCSSICFNKYPEKLPFSGRTDSNIGLQSGTGSADLHCGFGCATAAVSFAVAHIHTSVAIQKPPLKAPLQ
jgi:hypothetical protein